MEANTDLEKTSQSPSSEDNANTIAVTTPASYLTLNYKAAKELGVTISDDLLASAKIIIR